MSDMQTSSAADGQPEPQSRSTVKLSRSTLSASLLTQLRQQVLNGAFPPGSKLPTEREIGEAFGVGRTTVREALQGLVVAGFAHRQSGRLVVSDPATLPAEEVDYAALGARLSVREVFETRKLLEVEGARLAALQHTEAGLVELRALLDAMETEDREQYHSLHQRFHVQIVRMSGNRMLAQVYESSASLLFKLPSYWRVFGGAAGARPLAGGGRQGHEDLIAAIASGSAAEAAQAMYAHLDRVERVLIERIEISGATAPTAAPAGNGKAER